ncbi:TetR/AcrR family transcriptional regulator [Edaphobacter modestus]|uniref:TetR family transcriptional regulator n=1 Tax=Edaphobacter modestus TaxID=388466 RepID=A0A4Q7YUV9_9BACT|nr:TetR/AcrR family transcriptional regulator [Edaphobacter modestus]RZU41662.1 TetR family transcriptional regulator [Edaphobacter modestus]
MSKAAAVRFEPRKTPVQARSSASVEAIMQATIQVLLKDGKAKLTTTRIAERAGVSVGTLYQYFPNKRSLLQALLKEHLDHVALELEITCEAVQGASLARMAEAITSAFVRAKFRNIDASVALYAVSDDVEGTRIARGMHARATKAMTAVFQTAREKTITKPDIVAATLLSAMAGVSRAMLEMGVTRGTMATMEKELTVMVRAYLEASAVGNIP